MKVGDLVVPKERKAPWFDLMGKVVEVLRDDQVVVRLGSLSHIFHNDDLNVLTPMTDDETVKFIKKNKIGCGCPLCDPEANSAAGGGSAHKEASIS